jgi:glycosyltransferase involved in cell wall biosynthesis
MNTGNGLVLELHAEREKSMTDNRKICLIYCVNNDHLFLESIRSANLSTVPGGYTVENRIIKNANGIAKAYNEAMNSSNAKYKIYLHQDIIILNPNFLKEMVMLFLKYPKLGLLGVAGPKQMPPSGYWPHAPVCYGKFLWGEPGNAVPLAWNEVTADYEPVQAVDGIAMITQYDLPWRDDIFKGWHFYDISQSFEFIRAGYDVGIPRQSSYWFLHRQHNVSMAGYEPEQQLFLAHYGSMIF